MNKSLFLILAGLATASAHAQTPSAASPAAWANQQGSAVGMGVGVRAGKAAIADALVQIIPPPYTVRLDEAVPRETQLAWENAPDWMSALTRALTPLNLRAIPDWNRNTVTVTVNRPPPAPVLPQRPPVPPAVAAALNTPASPAQAAAPAAAPAAERQWKVDLADGSLSRALRRWGRDARMPVLWEAPKDLPAVASVYVGEFLEAIEQVMKDSASSSYPLHACAHDNVVRVLHESQACTR